MPRFGTKAFQIRLVRLYRSFSSVGLERPDLWSGRSLVLYNLTMFFTYILQSEKSGRLYIGQTGNISQRLTYHNNGKVKSTKNKGPWVLLFYTQFQTRQ